MSDNEHREWAIEQIYRSGTEGVENEAWFQRLNDDQRRQQLAHARQKASEYADKLLTAIGSKDIQTLKLAIHNGNSASKAIFTRVTGLVLRKTEKQNREVMRRYVGEAAWDTFHEQKEAEHKRRADEAARQAVESQKQSVLGRAIRYAPDTGGVVQTVTVQQLIDNLIADGYRTLMPKKRGRFTDWLLCKGNRCYTFRRKIEGEYIQQQLTKTQEQNTLATTA